jgi:PHD/YefM family antitoxin component YafN of YafNO toxin-antitoxin module
MRKQNLAITTLSSRAFNQDASGAKRAANDGPVFITDRGRPAHVLLSIELYRQITEAEHNIAELLEDPASAAVRFEPPKLLDEAYRPADFS